MNTHQKTTGLVLDQAHAKATAIMLVGLPASGKSTWREGLGDNFVFLSTDDLIEKAAKALKLTYSEAFPDQITFAEGKMWEQFRECCQGGTSFVLDRTNLSVKKRRGILSQIPSKFQKIAVYFEIDNEERQRRLHARPGKLIPAGVDQSMQHAYTRPTKEEGFDLVLPGGQNI